jgi:RNA polymerase sigma factor (sigma-70 family)
MLAFVPKAAGFLAIMMIAGLAGWTHGEPGDSAAPPGLHPALGRRRATMFAGNVLAILQTSVKRMLAYSSIAHSGTCSWASSPGPGRRAGHLLGQRPRRVLFYLLTYGVMNVGAFAVLARLERATPTDAPVEADDIADIRGLHRTRPHLAAAMLLCVLSLLGLPPLLGFFGKVGLFTSASARARSRSSSSWASTPRSRRSTTCLRERKRRDRHAPKVRIHAGASARGEPEADERVQDREQRRAVLSALDALSNEHRAVLVLRDVRGMDHEQIGAVLGLPVGTVKSRVFRARAALRGLLESGSWDRKGRHG